MKLLIITLCMAFSPFLWAQEEPTPVPTDENSDVLPIESHYESQPLRRKAGDISLGLQVGLQSGISAEYWSAESRSINTSLTTEHGNFGVSLAHLWMFRGAFPGDADPLVPYVGAGVLALFGSNEDGYVNRSGKSFVFAVQVPLGAEFIPAHSNWTIFGEVLPSFEVSPLGMGFTGVDAGFRYSL